MAVIPSGTVLNTTTLYNEPWFAVYLAQAPNTANGTSNGTILPALSGTGWGGSNNNGFVFQNDQYNTTIRGF
jgi:hypothetical protein